MSIEKMRDDRKTKAELLKEVDTLRNRVAKLTKKDSTLRESEEKWRSLLKNTPDIVMIVDRNGTIRFINHTIRGSKKKEVIGQKVYDYISPEHHDMMRKHLKSVFQTGRSTSHEISGVGRHGDLSWYHAEIGPIKQDGHIVAASIITRDITEHKKAEEKIEKFKEMADRATYGCAMADLNGNLTYINESFAKMHGYTPAELIGKNLKNFHAYEKIKRVSQLNKRLIETGEGIRGEEVWHVRRNGTEFPTLMSSWILKDPDGNPYLLCATAIDITELNRAEEVLRGSENKYRTLLENLPQKIFFKDRNSVYFSCNENYAEDFKIKSEEIVGKTDYDLYSKELAEKYRADDKRIMESGGTEDIEEKYIRQGQEMVVHTVKTPVKDAQGNIIGILGIFWDITEHKKAENALRESEKRYRVLFQRYR
jgi:PAS domain S-box-containing protein